MRCTLTSTPHKRTGGTRFIGVFLARELVKQGHEVTLYTRGKKALTSQLATESDADYEKFKSSIKHIAGDRLVRLRVKWRVHGARLQL